MRAPPLLALLLMAAVCGATSPLARLNPWLSACDLHEEGGHGARECGVPCGGEALVVRDLPRLCALPADGRARRLERLRLRACCERSPASALDRSARALVAAGGARCESTLRDLIDLDGMAARVHCDFAAILGRYDCEQSYSVHTCDKCQETYRRWACSTMVPLWVEEGADIDTEAASSEARARRAPAETHAARWHSRHLERVGHLDRRRGGGVVGRWVRAAAAGPGRPHSPVLRLKPCLAVCQLVEQHCPYFLPADRAPAYPTQYAGEPTFLCLDSRIPETGAQANNSNYGPEECCYWHCRGGLCYRCDSRLSEAARPDAEVCPAVEERLSTCAVPYQPFLEAPHEASSEAPYEVTSAASHGASSAAPYEAISAAPHEAPSAAPRSTPVPAVLAAIVLARWLLPISCIRTAPVPIVDVRL